MVVGLKASVENPNRRSLLCIRVLYMHRFDERWLLFIHTIVTALTISPRPDENWIPSIYWSL